MMRACDLIIAKLTPFRRGSADAGKLAFGVFQQRGAVCRAERAAGRGGAGPDRG
ncbi:hypothetical protein ACFQS7_04175 [Dankookia sp. GCM10030260]|uniref:hypothetical protein n=1 Tax=Dankookia sp. GCM10030260 TaxID=3273390 RepID=UPI003614A419